MPAKIHRVFVYGTLKRGQCRHNEIADQHFIAVASTQACYRLFNLGDYPGLIFEPNGNSIEGELYEVDDECLKRLDVIEGVDHGLYSRQPIDLLSPWNDRPVVTYMYQMQVEATNEIFAWPPN